MLTRKYVIMMREETGEKVRAYGDAFLEAVHIFQSCADEEVKMSEEDIEGYEDIEDEEELKELIYERYSEIVDEVMDEEYAIWSEMLLNRAYRHWEQYGGGEEVRLFIERLYSDISLREWRQMGYDEW